MPLVPGTRLGSYEVLSSLGAGGMGEVYRARDTKLHRDVALKILPDLFTGDADRLARFEREARVLASLNHPNIAHVYDAGRLRAEGASAGQGEEASFLVMELVEGEDLSAHILRGPMPLADVIPIARQIADALESAHESGIVHRDLKPANVKVRTDGTVKVLDFGLAKVFDSAQTRALAPDGARASADAMNSPTLTAAAFAAGTQIGMIIGTAAYMAPEQARGRAVDRRADIWAFGAVLYEMLAGKRAFEGDDVSITLASVLKEDVRWNQLPSDTPASMRRLLRRCLEKDPKRRLGWIGEARALLDDSGSENDEGPASVAAAARTSTRWRALPWIAAAAGLGAALAILILWSPWRTPPAVTPMRLLASIGVDATMPTVRGASAILSPDGKTLAFVAQQVGRARLFVRKLDQLHATALAGTEGAESPFFSPSGQWIAFFADGQLKKVGASGGSVVKICDASVGRGGTFVDEDTVVLAANTTSGLVRVSAGGGTTAPVTTLTEGATTHRWPSVLPGGRFVLFTEHTSNTDFDKARLAVAPVGGGPAKVVVRGAYYGRYAAGRLLYMERGTVFAVPFDLNTNEVAGQAAPVVEGVSANPGTGSAQFAVSSDGTLVHVPGSAGSSSSGIEWLTRDGKSVPLRTTPGQWVEPRFSPDGHRLALVINDGKQDDIWVLDVDRDTLTQLTFDPGRDRTPVWSHDGRLILFSSDRAKVGGPTNLYGTNADGSGEVTRLTDSPNVQVAFSWNETFVFFQEDRGGFDLMVLPLTTTVEGSGTKLRPGATAIFLSAPGTEVFPQISPDGRWLAYFSDEAGGPTDVYVRPFPGPGGKWRISTEGGSFAKWSQTSRELLYLSSITNKVMVVPYTVAGDSFRAEKTAVWSATGYEGRGNSDPYAIHPDGKRLALSPLKNSAGKQDQVVFVLNFADYLKAMAPARR